MKNRGFWIACVLLCVILIVAEVAAARATWRRAEDEPVSASLGDVCADPLAFLGRDVQLRFQVESRPESWNPYLTRFGSGDFRALRVWADEQLLWRVEDWDAPCALLFARRGSVAEKVVEDAPRLARFECLGHVREVFLGRPWIEIEHVQRIPGAIGEGSLLHAGRALELIDNGQWQLAAENLDRALVGDMPDAARAELRRLRAQCDERLPRR